MMAVTRRQFGGAMAAERDHHAVPSQLAIQQPLPNRQVANFLELEDDIVASRQRFIRLGGFVNAFRAGKCHHRFGGGALFGASG